MSFSSVDDAGADERGAGLQSILLDLLAEVVPLHAILQGGGAVELIPFAEVVAAAGAQNGVAAGIQAAQHLVLGVVVQVHAPEVDVRPVARIGVLLNVGFQAGARRGGGAPGLDGAGLVILKHRGGRRRIGDLVQLALLGFIGDLVAGEGLLFVVAPIRLHLDDVVAGGIGGGHPGNVPYSERGRILADADGDLNILRIIRREIRIHNDFLRLVAAAHVFGQDHQHVALGVVDAVGGLVIDGGAVYRDEGGLAVLIAADVAVVIVGEVAPLVGDKGIRPPGVNQRRIFQAVVRHIGDGIAVFPDDVGAASLLSFLVAVGRDLDRLPADDGGSAAHAGLKEVFLDGVFHIVDRAAAAVLHGHVALAGQIGVIAAVVLIVQQLARQRVADALDDVDARLHVVAHHGGFGHAGIVHGQRLITGRPDHAGPVRLLGELQGDVRALRGAVDGDGIAVIVILGGRVGHAVVIIPGLSLVYDLSAAVFHHRAVRLGLQGDVVGHVRQAQLFNDVRNVHCRIVGGKRDARGGQQQDGGERYAQQPDEALHSA